MLYEAWKTLISVCTLSMKQEPPCLDAIQWFSLHSPLYLVNHTFKGCSGMRRAPQKKSHCEVTFSFILHTGTWMRRALDKVIWHSSNSQKTLWVEDNYFLVSTSHSSLIMNRNRVSNYKASQVMQQYKETSLSLACTYIPLPWKYKIYLLHVKEELFPIAKKEKNIKKKIKADCKAIVFRSTLAKCYLALDSPCALKSKLSLKFFKWLTAMNAGNQFIIVCLNLQ